MTVIYRIENDKGEGPYHGNARWSSREDGIWDADMRRRSPSPREDFKWLSNLDLACGRGCEVVGWFHFGFPSRDAAVEWFGEETLADLDKQGFKLRAFNVPHALVSDSGKQVMFNRAAAAPRVGIVVAGDTYANP